LVDFLPPTETFSAGEFCRQVKNLLAENPDKKYILVGGTGLYVQSLLLGLPNIPAVPPSVRKKFEDMAACEGSASLYKMACEVDPESAANVDPNNAQRLVRILEVFEATGRPLSGYQKEREG
jgi:tRNA dimethylallyltransferase